jgi:tetratricopeptide (TPR) repeat protein
MVHSKTDEQVKVLDVAFREEESFEEKCWFFFKEHSKYLTYALCLLVIIGSSVAIVLWAKDLYNRHVQNRFIALQNSEDKTLFAECHPSHPLAGACFLELADAAYQAKDYPLAVKRYEQAQSSLKHSIFGGRAALGKAMSFLSDGDQEEGRIALLSIATDVQYPQSIRAEAFYLSAILAMERGKPHKAQGLLQCLTTGDYGEIWKEQSQELAKSYRIEL